MKILLSLALLVVSTHAVSTLQEGNTFSFISSRSTKNLLHKWKKRWANMWNLVPMLFPPVQVTPKSQLFKFWSLKNVDDVADIFAHKIPASHEGKCIFFCLHKLFNAVSVPSLWHHRSKLLFKQNEDGSLNMAGALANLEIFKDLDADLYTKISTSFKNCEGSKVICFVWRKNCSSLLQLLWIATLAFTPPVW